MSIIHRNGALITYMETLVTCPICTASFDVSKAADRAKYPLFKMKCPHCKSSVGVSMPIFGGNTECFEWNAPKLEHAEPLKTITPNKFNGQYLPIKERNP